jgi:2'-5' RNA ligase
MRIFIGIDLDPAVRARIERFLEGVEGFAPDARWVRSESLHITLKFIGEQSPERVEAITERLRRVESSAFAIRAGGYGFFPTAKAPRVFWIGIHAGPQLAELAESIDMATAELGIPREDRPYSPHLTLARAGAGRSSGSPKRQKGDGPNATFAVLAKRLAAMGELDFGTMTADEFILYQSQLSPRGSKYTKLQRFPMRADAAK